MGDVWDSTVGAAYDFVTEDVIAPIVNAVEQIPIIGDVVKGGLDVVHEVTDFLGPVGTLAAAYFGGPMLSGAAGATMTAEELAAANAAYIDAGFTAEEAAGFLGEAAGVEGMTAGTLSGIIEGGGTLNMAAQGAFQAAGGGLSSVLSGAKTLGNVAKVGTQIYNAFNPPNTQTPTQAQNSADPYAPYRAQNAAQLNQLVADPSSITRSGGYQQGLNQALTGTQRQLAQTGQSMSGMGNYNMALTSGDYFNTQFNQQYNRLAELSGAKQSPSVGQNANYAQQTLNATSEANRQRSIVDAAGGLGDLLKSYWG